MGCVGGKAGVSPALLLSPYILRHILRRTADVRVSHEEGGHYDKVHSYHRYI